MSKVASSLLLAVLILLVNMSLMSYTTSKMLQCGYIGNKRSYQKYCTNGQSMCCLSGQKCKTSNDFNYCG